VLAQGDPYHAQYASLLLGMFLVHRRDFEAAVDRLAEVIHNSERQGTEYLKIIAKMFLGVALAAQGKLGEGIRMVESAREKFSQYQRNIFHCFAEFILGNIYLSIMQGSQGKSLSFFFRNLGSIIKHVPFAGKKAEKHLSEAIKLARAKGAKGFLGQPCLQLGLLWKLRGKKDQAKKHFLEALQVFEECQMEAYSELAAGMLESLA
jgi:tetratricopeptide (TPR) repeat protein